jgi:hypothetical protein
VDGKTQPTTSELIIMIAGAVMLVASFLDFRFDTSSWARATFPIATLLPLYGVVMAVQIALTKFAGVNLPDQSRGSPGSRCTWCSDSSPVSWPSAGCSPTPGQAIGLWLEMLGGIALASVRDDATGAPDRRDRLTGGTS